MGSAMAIIGYQYMTVCANLALPCRIGEFSCLPPHNEEEKHYFHANDQQLVQNFCQLILANGHMCYDQKMIYAVWSSIPNRNPYQGL